MMMAVVSIIGSESGFSFDSRLLQDVSLSVNVYILIIPYFTFVPTEPLFRALLGMDH
eukprot:CAMPEP_0114583882 /NCGR_PEP_ID=MMETSP0125-20121206/7558_1 /TAXON_ID=485358 ORGANISM="Aristerostoma sp., Strain ATCC 50986" /NCGR_SAMPLE_ID=MMETSP0125 /ASSEMBLY_ACC=CAM_ASM_000245 /LENGTH=56 /DNA_ID=CAMNT_0001777669 /DNA_START=5052 /DNA_END=5222 /DNA_ORIENTATION=+